VGDLSGLAGDGLMTGRRLTDTQAEMIVSDPRSLRRIASDYGVSPGMVSKIKNGRRRVNATKGKRDPRPGGYRFLGRLKHDPCIDRIVRNSDFRWRIKLASGCVLIDDVPTASGFVRQVVTEFERRSLADVAWEIRQGWVRPA
jgi:hypothetical protein